MNTLAHLAALLAITDFTIDMFTVFNERTLGVALIGVWFLYVALTFKGMLDDWHYFMGETSEGAALITPASVGAVGVLLFILGIKIAHIIWG